MQSLLIAAASAGGCVVFLLAVAMLRSQRARGGQAMAFALFAMSAWIWLAALEPFVADFALYLLVVKAKYSAVALTPAFTALGVASYASRTFPQRRAAFAVLSVPVLTIALTWTNEAHQWMWAHPPLGPAGERTVLLPWGPWFWRAHLPFSYALAAFAIGLLARELWRPSKLDRLQLALLLAGVLLPLVTNALFVLGVMPSRFGPTPLAMTVSGLLFAWGFLRRGLFRLAPVAHQVVLEHMRDGVLVADAAGRIQLANPAALAITGREALALRDRSLADVLPDDPSVRGLLGASASAALLSQTPDGRHIEIAMSPIREASGQLGGRIFLLRDVTERERALSALRQSEALVRGLVEHSPNGILRLRPRLGPDGEVRDFDCVFANAAAAAQLGQSVDQLVDRPFKGAVHPHTAGLFQAFREAVRSGMRCEVERSLARRGRDVWVRFLAVPAGGDLIVTCVDVTDVKLRERAMQAAAAEDALTGLLNRRGLETDAPSLLRDPNGALRACAALYLDLDRFKEINDALGHETGDLVLCEIAARLQRCTRGPDLLARLGGDEFVLLLFDTGIDGALWVAQRLLESSREPILVNGNEIRCVPSIGVALHPDDGLDLKALLQAADRAMYAAKSGGLGVAVASREREPSP